jgi:tape measure domain-containing protein
LATDLERLVVQLSADVKGYERGLARARGVTNREFNGIEKRATTLNRKLNDVGKNAGRSFTAPLAGIGSALAVAEVIKYADAWTVAGNKIAAAGAVSGRAGRDLSGITDIANATRTGITETADLYAKLLRSTKDVAKNEEEVARATEIVNKAFKAGGAAAQEQSAGILQLSQALGSGILQGDELRSIRENAPLLAQAIADEFGVTIGALKDLGSQGALTADRVFKAILKAQPQIEKAFSVTNATIADSFTKIENQFIRYIGQTNEGLGASQRLTAGLKLLADNFDAVADTAIAFASILGAALLGRSIGNMIASIGLGIAAIKKLYTAFKALRTVGAAGLLGATSGAAGPIGAAIAVGALAAGVAITHFQLKAAEAEERSKRVAAELEKMGITAHQAAEGVDDTALSLDKISKGDAARSLRDINDELDRMRGGGGPGSLGNELGSIAEQARAQTRGLVGFFSTSEIDKTALDQIAQLADDVRDGKIAADEALKTLRAMADTEISRPVYDLNKALQVSITLFRDLQTAQKMKAETPGVRVLTLSKQLEKDTKDYATAAEQVRKAAQDALDRLNQVRDVFGNDPAFQAQVTALETVRDSLDGTAEGSNKAKAALQALADSDPGFAGLAAKLNPLLDKLGEIGAAIKKAAEGLFQLNRVDGPTKFMPREGVQAEQEARKQAATTNFLRERTAKSAGKYEAWTVIGRTSEGRLIVVNPDEGLSTELTQTVEDPRGGFMNVPTLFSGKPVPIEEAVDKIIKNGFKDPETGRAIENFKTVDAAVKAAQARSASLSSDPKFIEADRKFTEVTDPELAERTQKILKAAEEVGVSITEAAAKIQAGTELSTEKLKKGVDSAIDSFVDHVVNAESGGNPNAKNPRSSATGLGQFIESTWLRLFRENFPDRAASMSNAAILAMRTDAQTSRTLIEAYARQNADILQKAGISVDEAALQLAHFLGPGGAMKVLQAAPGTPVADVLSPDAIKANPEILGGGATVDDVRGYAERRAGMNTVLARENELREKNRDIVAEMISQGQEETARIQLETSLVGASNAEREKEMFIFERLNELHRQGIPLTDELRAKVEEEANARFNAVSAYDATTEAADRLKEKQEELKAVQEEVSYAFQGALKGFISDLVHGKSATEALYNAVSQLADRLLDIALDQIFKSLFSGGAGAAGGLFGGLFGGFAAGGYTGDGGKNQPKGVVHGGEYVFSKKATSRIGVANLEAMHKAARRGYAEGGYVLPRIGGTGGVAQAGAAAPNVDARTTVINRFDAPSFLSEALAHPEGAKTILNVIRAQPAVFRQALQG